jgi:predicted outer membrane repeat protein
VGGILAVAASLATTTWGHDIQWSAGGSGTRNNIAGNIAGGGSIFPSSADDHLVKFPEGESDLYFPESTFLFQQQIVVDKSFSLEGADNPGGGRTVFQMENKNYAKTLVDNQINEKTGAYPHAPTARYFYFYNESTPSSGSASGTSNIDFIGVAESFVNNSHIKAGNYLTPGNSTLDAGYSGGAIRTDGEFSDAVQSCLFSNNSTCYGSGAIYYSGDFVCTAQSAVFADNSIGDSGGAIHVEKSIYGPEGGFIDLSGFSFRGNVSNNPYGGAIYCGENAKLAAQSDDVIFTGNWAGSLDGGSTAPATAPAGYGAFNRPNSLHFANLGGENTVAIGANEGRTFRNYDPISGNVSESGAFAENLIFQINPETEQTGTVLFDWYRSDIWFQSATVSHGTMVLRNGASFGAGTDNFFNKSKNDGVFTLEGNATLRVVYCHDSDDYEFNNGAFSATHRSIAYDSTTMRSEIGAGSAHLYGKMQFVLPPNFDENVSLLSLPGATVTVYDSASINVGVSDFNEDTFQMVSGQSAILLDCQNLVWSKSPLEFDCDGESIPHVRSGHIFHVWKNATQILMSFIIINKNQSSSGSLSSSGGSPSSNSSGSSDASSSGASSSLASSGSASSSGASSSVASSDSSSSDGSSTGIPRKSPGDGWLAGVALVNGCWDLPDALPREKVALFLAAGGGRERYRVGSCIELRSSALTAGLTGKVGPLVCGAFFEGVRANVHTETKLHRILQFFGSGRALATGGGIFSRLDFSRIGTGRPFWEIAGRAGSLRNQWHGPVPETEISFKGQVPYWGVWSQLGCRWENHLKYALELYGKYLWSHLGHKNFANEEISFRPSDSHRVRLGFRLSHPPHWKLMPWLGGYYERELAGKIRGAVGVLSVPQSSLKGSRAAGEFGLSYRPAPAVLIDLSLHGSVGRRRGVGAVLRAKREF